jgi:hypothetical protein
MNVMWLESRPVNCTLIDVFIGMNTKDELVRARMAMRLDRIPWRKDLGADHHVVRPAIHRVDFQSETRRRERIPGNRAPYPSLAFVLLEDERRRSVDPDGADEQDAEGDQRSHDASLVR